MPTFTHSTHSTHSYNGYKKSKVFAEWQKRLQKQEYEAACHWTAELDVSGWADDLWAKVVVYASKHVHLHSPSQASAAFVIWWSLRRRPYEPVSGPL